MRPSPPSVADVYTAVLERAILNLRMRIRYGEEVSTEELHDLLDALHNIPRMLRDYGGWFVETNIDKDLARYDDRWAGKEGSELREPLLSYLPHGASPEGGDNRFGEQPGTGQPATRPVDKPKGSEKPQPEAEGRCP
jgi:hypothetical protein